MSWIQREIRKITVLNEQIREVFGDASAETMDWKPDADKWSANECFDHIVQTNRKYYDTLDAIARGEYKGGRWMNFLVLPRLLGKMILKIVSPTCEKKAKTSPRFFPLQSSYGENFSESLIAENEILIEKIRQFQEEELDRVIVISPAASFVTYSLRDAISILVNHEHRHYRQALRTKLQAEAVEPSAA